MRALELGPESSRFVRYSIFAIVISLLVLFVLAVFTLQADAQLIPDNPGQQSTVVESGGSHF